MRDGRRVETRVGTQDDFLVARAISGRVRPGDRFQENVRRRIVIRVASFAIEDVVRDDGPVGGTSQRHRPTQRDGGTYQRPAEDGLNAAEERNDAGAVATMDDEIEIQAER